MVALASTMLHTARQQLQPDLLMLNRLLLLSLRTLASSQTHSSRTLMELSPQSKSQEADSNSRIGMERPPATQTRIVALAIEMPQINKRHLTRDRKTPAAVVAMVAVGLAAILDVVVNITLDLTILTPMRPRATPTPPL